MMWGKLSAPPPANTERPEVLPIVSEFLKALPEIDVRLLLSDRVVNLFEDPIDLAVRIGELPDSSLVATRVGAIRRVVCASPDYFSARGIPKIPGELAVHDCITFEVLMAPEAWTFGIGRSELSVPIHSRLVINTAEAAIDAAIAGVGITRVLSYQIATAIRAGTLVIALQEFEPAPWPVSLVYSGGRLLPLKLRAFLDFAALRLKGRLAEIRGRACRS